MIYLIPPIFILFLILVIRSINPILSKRNIIVNSKQIEKYSLLLLILSWLIMIVLKVKP